MDSSGGNRSRVGYYEPGAPPAAVMSNGTTTTTSGVGGRVSKGSVETFLDDNNDFLEDYIQRKVHRSQLEKWLFRPNRKDSYAPACLANQIKRQRSRSFTPLRKLSASKFEESGLSTPILSTDVDGQVTFLRTTSKHSMSNLSSSYSTPPTTSVNSRSNSTAFRYQTAKTYDRNQSVLLLIEDVFRESDVGIIAEKLVSGLKSILKCGHVSILLNTKQNLFSGDFYSLDGEDNLTTGVSTANRLMTAVLTSRQTLHVDHPDLKIDGKTVKSVLISPLINLETGKVVGALQVAVLPEDELKDSFSRDEEGLTKMVSRFASIALLAAVTNNEMRLELTRSEVFLELAHTVFQEQSRIEPTIRRILSNFLTMIECERCQILLVNSDEDPKVFKRVFDLQRSDLNEEGEVDYGKSSVSFEGRFPINAAITGEVAATGEKINIHNMQMDER